MTDIKNKESMLSCEVVQDLLPTYVDGLASRETADLIEKHIEECDDCRAMLQHMKTAGVEDQNPDDRDRKEIDFLRKSRRKSKRAVIIGIIATLIIAAAAIGAKQFLIGSEYRGDLACDIRAAGNSMSVGVTAADSIHVIRGADFKMNDGVVRGSVRAVMPGIYHSSGVFTDVSADEETAGLSMVTCDWAGDFSFDEDIQEIWIGDKLYWAGGKEISSKVSEVFSAGHDYIGDAPQNGALLTALGVNEDLGSLYSELETDREPYVWTIILEEDQTKYRPEYLKERLSGYGCILLASVGNLGEVDFRYNAEGRTEVTKVTAEDASAFFGRDIKICLGDAGALSELMEKAGIE